LILYEKSKVTLSGETTLSSEYHCGPYFNFIYCQPTRKRLNLTDKAIMNLLLVFDINMKNFIVSLLYGILLNKKLNYQGNIWIYGVPSIQYKEQEMEKRFCQNYRRKKFRRLTISHILIKKNLIKRWRSN
jgi:hypothetical protein